MFLQAVSFYCACVIPSRELASLRRLATNNCSTRRLWAVASGLRHRFRCFIAYWDFGVRLDRREHQAAFLSHHLLSPGMLALTSAISLIFFFISFATRGNTVATPASTGSIAELIYDDDDEAGLLGRDELQDVTEGPF